MTHPERDADILMLAHGALSPLVSLRTRWHLMRCDSCRRRLRQFQLVSASMANEIRDPKMPRWSVPLAKPHLSLINAALLTVAIFIVLVIGTLAVHKLQHPPVLPVPIRSAPCRPDLPSDRCT